MQNNEKVEAFAAKVKNLRQDLLDGEFCPLILVVKFCTRWVININLLQCNFFVNFGSSLKNAHGRHRAGHSNMPC